MDGLEALIRENHRVAGSRRGARQKREEKRLAIERGAKFRLQTPVGSVTADKMVFATNAYSHLFPELKRRQTPAWTYMIATAPLSDRHFAKIRWAERHGVEDARNLVDYYRITPANRLAMGGGPVGLSFGEDMNVDSRESARRRARYAPLGRPFFR